MTFVGNDRRKKDDEGKNFFPVLYLYTPLDINSIVEEK